MSDPKPLTPDERERARFACEETERLIDRFFVPGVETTDKLLLRALVTIDQLEAELARLKADLVSMANRLASCSEALGRRAMKDAVSIEAAVETEREVCAQIALDVGALHEHHCPATGYAIRVAVQAVAAAIRGRGK